MASSSPTPVTAIFRSWKGANPATAKRSRGVVFASESSAGANPIRKNRNPGVDTRIHWDNQNEGWVGGKSSAAGEQKEENFGEKFSELLKDTAGSHYEFLGVSAQADLEEIKAAYRRLTKEYHPDTTTMPLKAASDKFMRLREAYDVLSNEEKRRFYDWSLAQEAASRQAERMKLRLEDPYEQDVKNWESVPDTVDRLGGKNMKLSDQTLTAITIDVAIIIFTICCAMYVVFFKEPNY
ncbi:unnamed protein product [Victoria cruziana]